MLNIISESLIHVQAIENLEGNFYQLEMHFNINNLSC